MATKASTPKVAADAAAVAVAFSITSALKIDLPVKESKRGNPTKYPFETLTEVGTCFGVKGKTAKNLSSVISAANRRAVVQVKDALGNPVFNTKTIDVGGVSQTVPDTENPVTNVTAKYRAIDVDDAVRAAIKGTVLENSDTLVQRII